jgi:hypothetical protein
VVVLAPLYRKRTPASGVLVKALAVGSSQVGGV